MHTAAAYAWARSEIPADGVCSPTNGRASARNASAFINLSLDDSAICLLGQSHHDNSFRICACSLLGTRGAGPLVSSTALGSVERHQHVCMVRGTWHRQRPDALHVSRLD
jgi:hypothetical protein